MHARKFRPNSQSGFTLIEILIVIVIIGILAAIGLGSFRSSQIKSRDSRRKSDLKNIATALELYYNDKRSYPLGDGSGGLLACSGSGATCTAGLVMSDGGATYMVQFPGDPGSSSYYYDTDASGSYFRLYARLENALDSQSAQVGGEAAVYDGKDCGAAECNYGISSSNQTLPNPEVP